MKYKFVRDILLCLVASFALFSCHRKRELRKREIVRDVKQLGEVVPEQIGERLSYTADNKALEDKVPVHSVPALQYFYQLTANQPKWSVDGQLLPAVDSMLYFIDHADEVGLPAGIYHRSALDAAMQELHAATGSGKDAALLAQVDVMMTDAFMKMATHLRYGIAPRDSITLRPDSVITDTTLVQLLTTALKDNNISGTFHQLEPANEGYHALKAALLNFKAKYQSLHWDSLPVAYADTPAFKQLVLNRLVQTGHADTSNGHGSDTTLLKEGVKAFQHEFNLYEDGQAGKKTVQVMNKSFHDWMIQAAVNLDRWRKWPDSLPTRYIFVNIPGYHMMVWDSGQVILDSRVIVGAPRTRTPLLNSRLSNFVMYPYWRVPFSISIKEMLPAIQKDPHYLTKKNLEVIDRDGNAVDPDSVPWKKFNKNYFPYVLRQMDGLENSLGIMKFNFFNKYAVYLHDTNNRGLFKNAYRAMSHGCVRIQQWDSLAMYLIKDDKRFKRDSVRAWLDKGQKKQIDLSKGIPIYLRYYTAEGKDGKMMFYEDIYGEDKVLKKLMSL
ncbi:L,D-transpeptidase family protein [Chitinophaga sp.]|uniref:L,D-transpeptidase family protein n=1 Tax=Chitinophaga sp. TaxID=1869181 RepID=UPI0031DD181F